MTTLCSVDGCARAADGRRGFCNTHYLRWKRGWPDITIKSRVEKTLEERLWERVLRDASDCWLWCGPTNRRGYGQLGVRNAEGRASTVMVHRYSYERYVGPIPSGWTIDHLCGNTACVNPRHMEPVTRGENSRRAAMARSNGECKWGHARTPENTYWCQDGTRRCRPCNLASARASRERTR